MDRKQRVLGKRVLITGSGTGIGREMALEFAREKAVVTIHYAHSETGAKSALREIRDAGGKAEMFKADLNSVEETRELATRAIGFMGGLDVLINNAGITMNAPFEKVTPEQFDTLYRVNIRAQFFLTQAAMPSLLESSGAVINISSIHALEGFPEHSVYAGTKGAILAFTRQLAIEFAPKGVRVNAIAVGSVHVESYAKSLPGFDPAELGKLIPVGFVGRPVDIARVAVFLASEDARFIVGQYLVVDGGTTSWMPFSDAFNKPFDGHFGVGYVPGL
jgi:NAD(P)-dependent dehydrogenase (short-subunit alcohol dehydrogenase family)